MDKPMLIFSVLVIDSPDGAKKPNVVVLNLWWPQGRICAFLDENKTSY